MHRTLMTNDDRPQIIDALLTPIIMMGHGACHSLVPLSRRPILRLYIEMTISLLNYLTYKTKNRWRSVDAQCQNGAGSVRHVLLPIKPTDTAFLNGLNRLPCRLPMTQDQILLTLRWCSFCHGHIHNMLSFHWANLSLMVFWQPLYRLHVLSPSSIDCSLIIHINISFKIYFKVSANCR